MSFAEKNLFLDITLKTPEKHIYREKGFKHIIVESLSYVVAVPSFVW